ncbi:MAG: helix-turn-helix domain-containing protein [Solirubrobacterales bacterium]
MSERVERVREVLKAQLVEIEKEAAELEDALGSLDGGAPEKAPRRGRRAKARHSGSKRVARGERPKQFLAAVEANPGASVAEIAKAMGVSANQAGSLARRLEAKGEIRRSKQGVRVGSSAG